MVKKLNFKISVALACLFILVGCTSNNEHFKRGYKKGHDEGHEQGYSSGHERGYNKGYREGKNDGYINGYSEGETSGYIDGTTFFISETIAPTLGGWLLILAFITWSVLLYKYLKDPTTELVYSIINKVNAKRKKRSVKKNIRRKTKLLTEINPVKEKIQGVKVSDKISSHDLRLLAKEEKEKLEHEFILRIQKAKNELVKQAENDYIKLTEEVENNGTLSDKEKQMLFEKLELEFSNRVEQL